MIADTLHDIIRDHIGPVKQTRKGWQSRNCMMCHHHGESPDRRSRFGIIFSPDGSVATSCFNCGHKSKFVPGETFGGSFVLFLREIGISHDDITRLNFELYRAFYGTAAGKELSVAKHIATKWTFQAFPANALTLQQWAENDCRDKNFLRVFEYAVERGIRNFSDFYWTPEKEMLLNRRLIIPFTYNNRIVGYTGRLSIPPATKSITKYLNHTPEDFIYNLDRQFARPAAPIILTEGVIDAYMISGVSAQGNQVNEDQIAYLKTLGKPLVILPDFDKDGELLVNLAVKHHIPVSFPFWYKEIKDAAKACELYGRVATVQSVIEGIDDDPLSVQVKWRMYLNERN